MISRKFIVVISFVLVFIVGLVLGLTIKHITFKPLKKSRNSSKHSNVDPRILEHYSSHPSKPETDPELFPFFKIRADSLDYTTVQHKPVIYLYPTHKQEVYVKLKYQGKIIADYPQYNQGIEGWEVIAEPDSRLWNKADGKEYSYLFWEGQTEKEIKFDLSNGFVVKGQDTASFLQEILAKLGLEPKEYNEFIVYWLPKMKNNKFNLIHFAGKEYEEAASLIVTPKPDTVIRVFMVFKALPDKVNIVPQEINSVTRKGFTVVEWGGTEIGNSDITGDSFN